MRVLVVDDEALALDRLRTLFADIDEVEVVGQATDGDMALEQIETLQPDLVILDIQMPKLSGVRPLAYGEGVASYVVNLSNAPGCLPDLPSAARKRNADTVVLLQLGRSLGTMEMLAFG